MFDRRVAAPNANKRTSPRRVARGIGGALAIAAIVGGAVTAGLALFSGRSADPEVAFDPGLVAVAELENRTGDAGLDPLGAQTAARITEAVHRQGVAEVVGDDRAFGEGMENTEGLAAFARGSRAGIVIHGSYYVVGDSLQFQLQLTDAAKGELLSALKPVTVPTDRSSDAMTQLQERTVGALAAALDYRADDLDFPTQPPSLEAYRLFWRGTDARWRFEMEEALGFFRQAGAKDSTWMSPRLYESMTLGNMTRFAEEDSVLQIAAGLREHMSELEDLMFQALLAFNGGGDHEIGLRSSRKLATFAPALGLRWGYWFALYTHRPAEGLDFLARVDTTSPRFERLGAEYWRLSSGMHHAMGNFEEALEVARDGRSRFPDHMHLLNGQLAALAALGQITETEALLDTVLALPATDLGRSFVVPHLRALNATAELRSHGFPDAARTVGEHSLAWLESRPPEWKQEHPDWYALSRAAFLYELGRWEEARDLYAWLSNEPDYWGSSSSHPNSWEVNILASLAGASARLGDVEQTRAIQTEFAERIREELNAGAENAASRLFFCQARIAAVLGEREEAVRLLSEGFRISPNKGVFAGLVHVERDFKSLHDYPSYQQFLKPRG